jgi:predicted nucleic acid-binding Zn ribbon protein
VTRSAEHDEPIPLRAALDEVGDDLGLAPPDELAALVARWGDVVGEPVAAHARLRSLRDGILRVAVDDAPWATQLRYDAADVLRRAAEVVGSEVACELRVVVEPPRDRRR